MSRQSIGRDISTLKIQPIPQSNIQKSKEIIFIAALAGIAVTSVVALIISHQSNQINQYRLEQSSQMQFQVNKIQQLVSDFRGIAEGSQNNSNSVHEVKKELSVQSSQMQGYEKRIELLLSDIKSLTERQQNNTISLHDVITKVEFLEKDIVCASNLSSNSGFDLKPELQNIKDTLTSQEKEQKQLMIQLAISSTKLELISENYSQVNLISSSLSNLKKDFEQISLVKLEIESIKKELTKAQSDTSANNNNFTIQINSTLDRIDQIATKIDAMPLITPRIDSIESHISEIQKDSQQIPTLKDSISLLYLKINSDTFNKAEIFGPFYPNKHQNLISVNSEEFHIYQTTKPCILQIKGKAIVTLIATGHAKQVGTKYSQLLFMKDRQVDLLKTNLDSWLFGGYLITPDWNPVSLTQEFIVEQGIYEFTLWVLSELGSESVYLNAISFVAKVAYIS